MRKKYKQAGLPNNAYAGGTNGFFIEEVIGEYIPNHPFFTDNNLTVSQKGLLEDLMIILQRANLKDFCISQLTMNTIVQYMWEILKGNRPEDCLYGYIENMVKECRLQCIQCMRRCNKRQRGTSPHRYN